LVAKYFLGIRLPQELEKECEAWRRKFRAPRTVAHITLIPPFGWESEETDLLKLLKETVQGIKPFLVQGSGLGSFGRRVLFVNVELNEDFKTAQDQLAKALERAGIPRERRPYRPHITLATRLTPQQFDRYQKETAGFSPEYAFECNSISLFCFSPEGRWVETAKLAL